MNKEIIQRGLNISFFLFFALSLVVPSGYSYGAVGSMIFAIFGASITFRKNLNVQTKILLVCMIAMGLVWGIGFESLWSWTGSDLLPRYIIAAGVVAVVSVYGVNYRFVEWGLGAGALGALLIAGYQNIFLGITKATGYTNAIQYGGIAMYLATAAWCIALLNVKRKNFALMLWILGACGLLASLLSETRGAWVAVPVLFVVLFIVLVQHGYKRWASAGFFAACILVIAAMIPYGDNINHRITEASNEVSFYLENPSAAAPTSVGQRLEQWRAAYQLIKMHPWTGWGHFGNRDGKQMLVDQGQAHPSIMDYGHAHNEIIDMLAKRGIIGFIFLLSFYAIPLYLFWPSQKRMCSIPEEIKGKVLGIRLAATMLPIAYFCFGWTQVFFAHNSGNMFYIFGLAAFWGALQRLEGKTLQK